MERGQSKENEGIFRILDLDGGSANNSWAKYHIEDISGYHPAKLQSYKDFFESDKGLSYYMLKMLNVKYIIQNSGIQTLDAEERAYFINNLYLDHDDDKEKRFNLYMTSVKPSDAAYLTSDNLSFKLSEVFEGSLIAEINTSVYTFNIDPEKDVITAIDNSSPNEIVINFETSGPQFLAISEIYYPNGWHAAINQNPVDIYEVNDLIRGVFVDSSGEYELKMRFEPSDLKWGIWLSSIAFIIIIGMSALSLVRRYVVR